MTIPKVLERNMTGGKKVQGKEDMVGPYQPEKTELPQTKAKVASQVVI